MFLILHGWDFREIMQKRQVSATWVCFAKFRFIQGYRSLCVGDPSILSERFSLRGRLFFETGYHLEQMGVTFFEEKHFNNFFRKKSANYKGCNILEENGMRKGMRKIFIFHKNGPRQTKKMTGHLLMTHEHSWVRSVPAIITGEQWTPRASSQPLPASSWYFRMMDAALRKYSVKYSTWKREE